MASRPAFLSATALVFALSLALAACAPTEAIRPGFEPPLQGWSGGDSDIARPGRMLALDQDEWEAMWRLIGAPPPRNLRDGREMAAAVFLGPRQGDPLRVLIEGIRREAGGLEIAYRAQSPVDGQAKSRDKTEADGFSNWKSPWCVAIFPRNTGDPTTLKLGS